MRAPHSPRSGHDPGGRNAAANRNPGTVSLCPLHDAGTCRSCPHQGLPLSVQLDNKQEHVRDLLAGGTNPVPPTAWLVPVSSAPARFRNKAKMVVSGTADSPVLGILGDNLRGVDLRRCPLHVTEIEEALPVLAELVSDLGIRPYDLRTRSGELKHILVTASPDGDLMVRLVLRSRAALDRLRQALPRLRALLPTLAVLSVNIQPVHQAVIEGDEEIVLTEGPDADRLLMRLRLPPHDGGARGTEVGNQTGPGRTPAPQDLGLELVLMLPTRSFFQTNTAVAERLYATARAWARDGACRQAARAGAQDAHAVSGSRLASSDAGIVRGAAPASTAAPEPSGRAGGRPASRSFAAGRPEPSGRAGGRPEVVWDLFCGVGGFALALAGPGRQVLGVEISASAIDGAREAAALMGLGPDLVRFEAGDAHVLDPGSGGPVPDLLVVNPPRRGIGTELARRIEAAGVRRVLYSSCNPDSLARDLAAMSSLKVRRARLFDMFPHTDHAEVLVELVR